jgi:hypothetical protein
MLIKLAYLFHAQNPYCEQESASEHDQTRLSTRIWGDMFKGKRFIACRVEEFIVEVWQGFFILQ